ncbi:MAG: flagellar basal-body MS-ring/collar protein FliF [Rhodothermales bacterium]|nr:flagellar basal-body MS-ring/collar protein FliF [Rhodothermales bacterium]
MDTFLKNITAFFGRLSIGQRIAIGTVVVGTIAAMVGLTVWFQQANFTLLFGNLPETAASQVVEILQNEEIEYKLKDGGTAIFVPNELVYDLRLRFAREGIISDGVTGYEIFDQTTLGMTDFMQKLNLRRALEGELSRTISSIDQVEAARVHLVIPERSPFRESQNNATSSVVLELKPGARLSEANIQGITALVAGAVEGLEASDVNIIDTAGKMLSNPDGDDGDTRLTSTQMRLQQEKEQHLAAKAQSLLDEMLGAGNGIIRLNLELDFSRSVTENNQIDPESQTVIAEERLEEEGDADNASSSVKNYEVSRTVQTIEKSVGDIAYLSVSVILNYQKVPPPADPPEALPTYEPHSDAQIGQIESLIKESVGWRGDRGDGFAISQLRFDTTMDDQLAQQLLEEKKREQIEMYVRYGLMVLALGIAFWLIRTATQKAKEVAGLQAAGPQGQLLSQSNAIGPDGKPQLTSGTGAQRTRTGANGEQEDLILIDDVYTSTLSPEAKARLKAKHKMLADMIESIKANPEEAANLLRNWLVADKMKENNKVSAT